MLYTEKKEREYRFTLALRMGIPIFLLTLIPLVIFFNTLFFEISQQIVETVVLMLIVSIYFLFYLIYIGNEGEITDPLTRTFTRHAFIKEMRRFVKEFPSSSLALISVENISQINAHYGYEKGDKVLEIFSKRLGDALQKNGYLVVPMSHFHGGKFTLGLKGDAQSVQAMLEILLMECNEQPVNEIEVKVNSVVMQLSEASSIEEALHELFDRYSSRRESLLVDKSDEDEERSTLDRRVNEAVNSRSFEIRYQPVVDYLGKTVLMESSIKLLHEGKMIHQRSYLQVMGRLGIEKQFWLAVITVIAQELKAKEHAVPVVVALSPFVLRDPSFFKALKTLIKAHPILNEKLVLIFTESKVYGNMERFAQTVKAYQKMGVKIALDNIGVLNATVEYIKRLPIDMIRLDKSFTRHLGERQYTVLFESFIESAAALGIASWAKMIENDEEMRTIKRMGVGYLQGRAVGEIEMMESIKEQYEIR